MKETASRPGIFSYLETIFPLQKDKKLIGTRSLEFITGVGLIKGFSWGTITAHTAMEYIEVDNSIGFVGYGIGHFRRFSNLLGSYLGIEGTVDEIEFVSDLQLHISPQAFIRIQNAFGVTAKSYVPEVGILFHW